MKMKLIAGGFQVLLTNKLDNNIEIKFIGVVSPLFLTYTQLILMSFNNRKNNKCKMTETLI